MRLPRLISNTEHSSHSWFGQRAFAPIIASFLAMALLLLAYALRGIYPFGTKSLMLVDMYHQYVPFMAELVNKFQGAFTGQGAFSLSYSWSGGLGTNFYATMSYYLGSPFNLLLVFFGDAYVTEAVLVMTLLKVGLSAASFLLWIRAHTRQDGAANIAFSLMYALSGYVLCYAWNIMWLDGVYMMPLVLLGLQNVVRGKRSLLFPLSVCGVLVFNFYISFFVLVFAVLYYPLLLLREGRFQQGSAWLRITAKAVGLGALGVTLSAVAVLPTLLAIRLTSASQDAFPKELLLHDLLFDYLARFLVAAEPTVVEGKPNLYAGIAVLLLLPVYFLQPLRHGNMDTGNGVEDGAGNDTGNGVEDGAGNFAAITSASVWQRVGNGFLLLFLVMGFNINILNFIWHGFHFPNQLPYRNAFVFVFLLVTLSAEAFFTREKPGPRQLGIWTAVLVGIVILVQKLSAKPLGWETVYLSIGFVIAYAAMMLVAGIKTDMGRSLRRWGPGFAGIGFLLVVIAEMAINSMLTVKSIDMAMPYASRKGYAQGGDVPDLRRAIEEVQQHEPGFYRMEVYPDRTVNDPYLYGFNGLSIFSSMSDANVAKMMARYGYHSNDVNSYKQSMAPMLMNTLMGIKYLVQREGEANQRVLRQVASFGEVKVYRNPDALAIGYWVPASMRTFSSKNLEPAMAQAALVRSMTGEQGIYTVAPIQNMGAEGSTITTDGSGGFIPQYPDKGVQAIVRLYMKAEKTAYHLLDYQAQPGQIGIGKLIVADRHVSFDPTRSTVVEVDLLDAGTEAVIELWLNSKGAGPYDFRMRAYAMDMGVYNRVVSVMKDRQLSVSSFRDGYVKGNFAAPDRGLLMTTIPYDAGWTVRLDGQAVSTFPVDDGLLAFYLPQGTHQVEMRFLPRGFALGAGMSLGSLLVLVLLVVVRVRRGK